MTRLPSSLGSRRCAIFICGALLFGFLGYHYFLKDSESTPESAVPGGGPEQIEQEQRESPRAFEPGNRIDPGAAVAAIKSIIFLPIIIVFLALLARVVLEGGVSSQQPKRSSAEDLKKLHAIKAKREKEDKS